MRFLLSMILKIDEKDIWKTICYKIVKLRILEYDPYFSLTLHQQGNDKIMILTIIIVIDAKINKIAGIYNL